MPSSKPIDNIVSRLKNLKKDSNGYIASCPAHPDKTPSLSISEGQDGRVLLRCHAGCTVESILTTLNLKHSDLYPGNEQRIEATYKYQDASGNVIFEVVRLNPKGFYARHKENGKHVRGIKGIALELYRLPQLIKAVTKDRRIYIVEGEKDCDNLVNNFGITATTVPFGAKKWSDHYGNYFRDARIVIIPDNDKSGIEHANMMAHKLNGIAKSIRILALPDVPEHGDVSDWIKQGGTKKQLMELVKAAPCWTLPVEEAEDDTEIESTVKKKTAELNGRYATVMIKGKYLVIQPDSYDPSLDCFAIDFIAPHALEKKYAHDKLITDYRGQHPVERNCISVWLERPDRRDYDGIVFDPGVDHGSRYYNLWQGFAVQPRKAKIDLYLDHIYNVIASGDQKVYDHIIALMADGVQLRPKPGVAMAIIGSQGVGKGIFVKNYGLLFGRHFLHITQASHLTGRFNRHLAEGMVVFVDEAFWAGDKQAEGTLKALVTEERLMIEPKGCDAYPVKNHNRLFLASNNDWIVPAGMEERRFFVVRASDKHMQDREYFGRIQKQMDSGGREGLLRYLQKYKLDNIDLTAFPRTEELANQKLLSMDPVERFWYAVLQEGKLFENDGSSLSGITRKAWGDGSVESKVLFKAFQIYIEQSNGIKWFGGDERFGITLNRVIPQRNKTRIRKIVHYVFPSLKRCRNLFDQATGQKWDWPKTE
jgi:hypothetical protein